MHIKNEIDIYFETGEKERTNKKSSVLQRIKKRTNLYIMLISELSIRY